MDNRASRRTRNSLPVVVSAVFLTILVPLACGQDLKRASSTLAAKIAESGRKRVAVVDFTDLCGNVPRLGRYLAEEMSGVMVEDARQFRVIDRAHLKAILQEHKLANTGLIDPQTARHLGQLAGVDTLVTGTITSAFGENVHVMIKALDVSTAEILARSTAEIPKTDAIKSLLGSITENACDADSSTVSATTARTSITTQPIASVMDNSILFTLTSCGHSGPLVKCFGSVTNKDEKRRGLGINVGSFGYYTDLFDNLGNQYHVRRARLGAEDSPREQELEPELPIKFMLQFDGVPTNITRASIVLNYVIRPGARAYKVTLRDLPVTAE
jgi:hypothetical protein